MAEELTPVSAATTYRIEEMFQRPSEFDATVQRKFLQAGSLRGLSYGQLASVEHYIYTMAAIVILFLPSSPAAVVLIVVAVVVDTVDRMLWRRSWSHVGQESSEAINPFLADLDASSTIVIVGSVGWIKAAFLDAIPRFVFRAHFGSGGVPMSG